MPTISVVIPTYNRSEFLSGALATATGQTYDDIEVIVVDDGSEEAYAQEAVSGYNDNIKCITHNTNRGLSAARNTGIQHASGEYISFLDDDDRWHKTKLEKQVQTLTQNSEAGIATCLLTAINPDGTPIHYDSTVPNGDCSDAILRHNIIGTPSRVMVRASALDDVGSFDETLPTKQDWDLYIRLCQTWTVCGVSEYLCFRTVHKSMSSSVEALKRDKMAIAEKHKELMRHRDMYSDAKASIFEEIGRTYLGQNEFREGRQYLKQAVEIEATPRGLLLLGLSYTTSGIFQTVLKIKRSRNQAQAGEGDELTPSDIPGLCTTQGR